MARKRHRKDADHFFMQKLDRLIERIKRQAIGAGKGKIKKGGEGTVVESRACVIEGDFGGDCNRTKAVFHGFFFFFVYGGEEGFLLQVWEFLLPRGRRKRPLSREYNGG